MNPSVSANMLNGEACNPRLDKAIATNIGGSSNIVLITNTVVVSFWRELILLSLLVIAIFLSRLPYHDNQTTRSVPTVTPT